MIKIDIFILLKFILFIFLIFLKINNKIKIKMNLMQRIFMEHKSRNLKYKTKK